MTETEAFVALNALPGIGPIKVRRLLERFGGPVEILSANGSELRSVPGIGPEVASSIREWESKINPSEEIARASSAGARILTFLDPEYPALLKEIHDPPIVLYVLGSFEDRDKIAVGVVGPRKPSHYGTAAAKKLSYQLAYSGVTVASGLALGIDTAAHQAALAARGRTIAVVGAGLGQIYPPENGPLVEKIASSGAVVSEFPMGRGADRQTFPMRNRIVSGMSFGTLVVEAGSKSGALITANQAAEQGRAVYAVPGQIDAPNAIGTNRLIQQGAKLVTSAQDILDDMGLLFREEPSLPKSRPMSLAGDEAKVFDALGDGETPIDEVAARSGLPIHVVSSTLLALEIRKCAKALPGGRYTKTI